MIVATSLIAASLLCAKSLSTGPDALPAFQVTWGRYIFAMPVLLLAYLHLRTKFVVPKITFHLVRVLSGFFGVTAMFLATKFIPLADTTAISFTNPIIAMVLAIWILGEKIGMVRWGTAGLALVGAFFLVRPGMTSFQPAALIPLAAACLFAIEVIMLKLLSGREPIFQIVLIANLSGLLFSTIATHWFWQSPTNTQWLLLIATGMTMVTAQFFFTNAVKLGEASFILPFSYATLIFATFYDLVIFGVVPQTLSLIGGAIVLAAGVILAVREGQLKRRVSD